MTNGTSYTFKIRAVNAAGEGTVSDERSATPLPVPSAPENLTATPSKSGSGQATLRWDRHDDSTIIKWQYQYKAASSANYGNWRDVPNSGPTTTSYTRTGLPHNVLYDFQVRAVNAIGNGMPSLTSARPVAGKPGAPTLTATTYNNASTKLTWTKHSGGRWVDNWQYSTDHRLHLGGRVQFRRWNPHGNHHEDFEVYSHRYSQRHDLQLEASRRQRRRRRRGLHES